jgi:hypothetical protein
MEALFPRVLVFWPSGHTWSASATRAERELDRIRVEYNTVRPPTNPNTRAWLAQHPRVQLHLTPTSGSWLNMVEPFFSIITRQAIRRGNFTSVKDLIHAIEAFIEGWNDRCQPSVWTKTSDQTLLRATGGQGTSFARH